MCRCEQGRAREQFKDELVIFIATLVGNRRRTAVDRDEIDERTPLFQTGLVDSLGILELIAFVEETTGRRIPLNQIDLRHFGTVGRICRQFGPTSGCFV